MPSLVPIQAGHVPHGIDLSSTQRESPLAGKSGKEWRDFVKGLALVPGWRCGRALVSGGASELGARLSAAHDALSRARNCLVGATTVDLADIPFGGFTGIPYEVTRVGDWAKLPSTAMRTLLETALRRDGVTVDAITGANLSIVANVIAAMVTKGMNIGIGHDPSSGAFFPDSSRFSDLPEDAAGFAAWWRKHVSSEVPIMLYQMLATDRPAPSLSVTPGAINPCVSRWPRFLAKRFSRHCRSLLWHSPELESSGSCPSS